MLEKNTARNKCRALEGGFFSGEINVHGRIFDSRVYSEYFVVDNSKSINILQHSIYHQGNSS